MKVSMKCVDCNTVNFLIPQEEKETRRCRVCGGKLKEYTVDMKEDGETGTTLPEPIFLEILRTVIRKGCVSMSMIQRYCSVGYNCAGRAMDWMEDNGYITKYDAETPRKVLITKEEFEELYGPLDEE